MFSAIFVLRRSWNRANLLASAVFDHTSHDTDRSSTEQNLTSPAPTNLTKPPQMLYTKADEEQIVLAFADRLCQPSAFFTLSKTSDDHHHHQMNVFLDLRNLNRRHAQLVLENNAPLSLTTTIVLAFESILARNETEKQSLQPALRAIVDHVTHRQLPGLAILSMIRGLDVGSNTLKGLTEDIAVLSDTLETLFLTDNLLEHVPTVLVGMSHLSRLSLKANRLTSLHPQRDLPKSLMHLIATENTISEFQSGFYNSDAATRNSSQFSKLRKLMLAGNNIENVDDVFGVPASASHSDHAPRTVYDSLELLRVSRNRIRTVAPQGGKGSSLTSFRSLSWVSFAGNPMTADVNIVSLATVLPVDKRLSLMLHTMIDLTSRMECSSSHAGVGILGQGASGVVKLCLMFSNGEQRGDNHQPVAVKFFKRVSSDGSGADEISALAHVPAHPNIVAPVGYVRFPSMAKVVELNILDSNIADHMHRFVDEGQTDGPVVAMCFPLIHNKKPLANPPTIWTVSDDIYDQGGLLVEGSPLAVPPSGDPAAACVAVFLYTANALIAAMKSISEVYSVLGAFHAPGVRLVHGDLYAHNMFFGTLQEGGRAPQHKALFTDAFKAVEDARAKTSSNIPSNEFWANHGILVTDFGASFHYSQDAFHGNASRALVASEVNAARVFVRDLYESIIPLTRLIHVLQDATNDHPPSTTSKKTDSSKSNGASESLQYPARASTVRDQLRILEHSVAHALNVHASVSAVQDAARPLKVLITAASDLMQHVFFTENQGHEGIEIATSDLEKISAAVDRIVETSLRQLISQ
jgi:hypothetical protein